jgi:hypothetical protein
VCVGVHGGQFLLGCDWTLLSFCWPIACPNECVGTECFPYARATVLYLFAEQPVSYIQKHISKYYECIGLTHCHWQIGALF